MARPHPAHFVHTLLPQLVWRRPTAVRRELGDPLLARELLRDPHWPLRAAKTLHRPAPVPDQYARAF